MTTLGAGEIYSFNLSASALTAGVYPERFRQFSPIQILGVSAVCGFGFAPSGHPIILDLVADAAATSLWPTNPGNRPTILIGQQESAAETVPDLPIVNAGTSLRAQAVQVGDPAPGSYVVLNMRWRWL